jgi:hypothetical protein
MWWNQEIGFDLGYAKVTKLTHAIKAKDLPLSH